MLAYLSDEWVSALDEALAAAGAPAGVTLTVRQVVTDPHGDRSYSVWFAGGRAGARSGGAEPVADVTFTCDRATAVAIATGKERAQAAFLAGRLRLSGDSRALITHAGPLAALDGALAGLRSRTDCA